MMRPMLLAVNLDRSKQRWADLRGHLEALGLQAERFGAVDGAAPPSAEVRARLRALAGHEDLDPVLGCALSHAAVLARIGQRSDDGWTVVLEDDARLTPWFPEALPRVTAACPEQADLLFLHGHSGAVGLTRVGRLVHRLRPRAPYTFGTYGYAARPAGARRVLEALEATRILARRPQIDLAWMDLRDRLALYGSSVVLVEHADYPTTVGSVNRPYRLHTAWLRMASRMALRLDERRR